MTAMALRGATDQQGTWTKRTPEGRGMTQNETVSAHARALTVQNNNNSQEA